MFGSPTWLVYVSPTLAAGGGANPNAETSLGTTLEPPHDASRCLEFNLHE